MLIVGADANLAPLAQEASVIALRGGSDLFFGTGGFLGKGSRNSCCSPLGTTDGLALWVRPWSSIGEAKNPGPNFDFGFDDDGDFEGAAMEQDAWITERQRLGKIIESWSDDPPPEPPLMDDEVIGDYDRAVTTSSLPTQERGVPGRHLRMLAQGVEGAFDMIIDEITADVDSHTSASKWAHLGSDRQRAEAAGGTWHGYAQCSAPVYQGCRAPRKGRPRPPAISMAYPLCLQVLIPPPVVNEEVTCMDTAPEASEPASAPAESAGAAAAATVSPPPTQRQAEQARAGSRSKRTSRHRPRGGRRGKKPREAILTANTQGQSQLRTLVQRASDADPSIVAIAVQEHWARDTRYVDMQKHAAKCGWTLLGNKARIAESRPSAGTAVAVRSDRAALAPKGGAVDASPRCSPGSVSALWADVAVPGGILIISVYCHDSEVGSERNCTILSHAIAAARAHAGPWIMAGDWNCTPSELQSYYGWILAKASTAVVSAGVPTSYHGVGAARELDYFIAPHTMLPYVHKVELIGDPPTAPHRAVKVTFTRQQQPYLVKVASSPKTFGRVKPVGCARRPVQVQESLMTSAANATREDPSPLDAAYVKVVEAMEVELCGVTDRFTSSGPDLRYCGRSRGLRLVQRPVLPPRRAAGFGAAEMYVLALVWLNARMTEFYCFSAMVRRAAPFAAAHAEHFCRTRHRFARACHMKRTLVENLSSWAECWDDVRDMIPGVDPERLRAWADSAMQEAEKCKRKAVSQSRSRWFSWVRSQLMGGAGGLHNMIKRSEVTLPAIVGGSSVLTASPQHIVDMDRTDWAAIWEKFSAKATAPWRDPSLAQYELLPPPTDEEIKAAVNSFDVRTATGADAIHVVWLRWLSDDLLRTIARLFLAIESLGFWPHQLHVVMMRLIPKKTGGRRPIGIETTLVRLWERMRKPVVASWRLRIPRPYDCMASGISCEQAVYEQSVRDEAVQNEGLVSASALLDIVKAFETVFLSHIFWAAPELQFPMLILRLALEACAASRYLVYGNSVAAPVDSLTAIVAGSAFATDLLAIVLAKPIKEVLANYGSISVYAVVDDITMRSEGGQSVVASELTAAVRDMVAYMEDDLSMTVSRGAPWSPTGATKSVTVVGDPGLRKRLGTSMRAIGFHVRRHTKNLGVDYAPLAKRFKRMVQHQRRGEVRAREARIRRLPRDAAVRMNRTGTQPMSLYGATVSGIAPAHLREVRRDAARAYGEMKGRSTTARLLARRADPGQRYTLSVINRWSTMVWSQRLPSATLKSAWMHAMKTVGLATDPHSACTGGAGVLVTVLRDIGWTFPSHSTLRTSDGVFLDLRKVCPRTVAKFAQEDYSRAVLVKSSLMDQTNDITGALGFPRARPSLHHHDHPNRSESGSAEVSSHPEAVQNAAQDKQRRADAHRGSLIGFGDGDLAERAGWMRTECLDLHGGRMIPWLDPIAEFGGSKAVRTSSAYASAVSLSEGSWWSPWRRFIDGYAASPACSCGAEAACAWHMLAECKRVKRVRDEFRDQGIVKESQDRKWDPLFHRAVPARPLMPPDPVAATQYIGTPPSDKIIVGDAYTDGALKGRCRRVLRAGWAFIVVHPGRGALWGSFGSLPERYPTSLRAELTAILHALRAARGRINIYSDNAEAVLGFRMGRSWCTHPLRDGADIWRDIWARTDELGAVPNVLKVKAHLSEDAVLDGRIALKDWWGNRLADQLACRGVILARSSSPTARVEAAYRRAIRWIKWVAVYAAHWPEHPLEPTTAAEEQQENADTAEAGDGPQHPPGQVRDPEPRGPAQAEPAPARRAPKRAARSKRTAAAKAKAKAAVGRAAQQEAPWRLHHQSPHLIWATPNKVLCRRCGRSSAASAARHRRAFARTACSGSAAGRALSRLGLDANALDARCRLSKAVLAEMGYEPMWEEDRLEGVERAPTTPLQAPAQPEEARHDGDEGDDRLHVHDDGATRDHQLPHPKRRRYRQDDQGISLEAEPALVPIRADTDDQGPSSSPAVKRRGAEDDIPGIGEPGGKRQRTHLDPNTASASSSSSSAGHAVPQGQPSTWLAGMAWGKGHEVKINGPIAYCARCGKYAIERVGIGLTSACSGPEACTKLHVDRMRGGRHPISGDQLLR